MHTNTGAHMQCCFLPTALAILEVCSGERVLIMNSLTGFMSTELQTHNCVQQCVCYFTHICSVILHGR